MRDPEWQALLSWGRAAQARHRTPPLFLFTDLRAGDPVAAAARLPAGGGGVVFRHGQLIAGARAALLRRVRRVCVARRLLLSISGETHWRRHDPVRPSLTAAIHGAADIPRARRAGATFAFISPVFPTRSHPYARPLGVVRATRLAVAVRRANMRPVALGGVDARTVRRLAPLWAGMGGIDVFIGGE